MSTPPHDPPPPGGQSAASGEPDAPELRCSRCGAPYEPLQEYCLECGLRLVPLPRPVTTTIWSRESPVWLWTALAALLLVALAAGAIVALAATDDDDGSAGGGVSSLQETTEVGVPTPPTSTITIDTVTGPTTLTLPTTTTSPTTTTLPTTGTQATTTGDEIISWPSGQDGYTVVLRSTPTSEGRGPADAAARRAIDAGLQEVGVLNSSDYSHLNPGYYVTFAGVYDTQQEAESALPQARTAGFSTAYLRRIAD